MPMGNENEKKEQKINLCVSKDSLLHAFLAGYIRAFAVDLEEDSYELLYEKEEDPVISGIISNTRTYSAFNRQVSLLLPEPSFSSWREVMGSRENIRSMLKMQESFTFTFPRRGMENWMKIEVKQGLGRPTSDNNHSVHALRCEERKHPFVLSELTLFQCPNSASSVKARMHKRNILLVIYLLIFVVYEHADYIFRIAYR